MEEGGDTASHMNDQNGRYEEAVRKFFAIHGEDPREFKREGREISWSTHYHERMLEWLARVAPDSSEPLRLAASCQHIRRWKIPRLSYPEGKLGYKEWRRDLARYHGAEAAAVLEDVGYGTETTDRVRELLLKARLRDDPEAQVLEDVACLVFLENELAAFAARHEEGKVAVVLRKTWQKMSAKGQEEAVKLSVGLPEDLRLLVGRALSR